MSGAVAVAWIAEIQNLTETEYTMWCDAPPGPLAHLGVFNGDEYGNDKVPITPGTRYHVEWCVVPWSDGQYYRYLSGPRGIVRMYCATFEDADKLVFVNDSSGEKIGNLPIGTPHSQEYDRTWFVVRIDEKGLNWEVQDSNLLRRDILDRMRDEAATLARALITVLG